MISNKYKFIFIHIPRTGGSSIEAQFNYSDERVKHASLKDLLNKTNEKYFKFTFIRNPWDIIISKYFCHYHSKINAHSGKSLLFFLTHYTPASNESGNSFFDYFDPEELDFIGRYENREGDLKIISKRIGFTIDPLFSSRKKEMQKKYSKKSSYTEYYDEETKAIVAKMYKKEIEYFGYTFDGE